MAAPTDDKGQGTGPKKTMDKLMDHQYDGIQEYDNPMPRWWLLSFAGTVIFSVIYLFNVGPVGNGKGRIADYENDMKAFALAHPAPTGGDVTGAQLLALSHNHEALEDGKKVFQANCSPCHRPDGGGLIGPNLTDTYWIHGGTLPDIYKTVTNGVLEKGMPPWGKMLKPAQVQAVVAYVASLQGSNPVNPKAPQGVVAVQ
ncbi:MAG: cbb3-type cytochrome c oxidase N-terminal domain-containing protein [bacterium]